MTINHTAQYFDNNVVDMRTMTITPEIAKNILNEGNYDNRNIRKGHVQNLASRILRGEWKLTPQGIILHTSGRLLDGQHRLLAIVQADTPVTTTVFTVSDESVFKTLDQGAKRSMADISGVDGRVMDSVNFCTRLMLNRFASLSYGQVEPVLSSSVGKLSKELIEHCGVSRKGLSSSPVKAACVSAVVFGSPKWYAFNMYRDLIQGNYDNLPPIGKSYTHQIITGSIDFNKSNGGRGTYVRSVMLFDYTKRNTKKIRVSPHDVNQKSTQYGRDLKLKLQREGSLDFNWGAR
jgi:hypothetical protein